MISLTPVWLNPLNPSLRSRFSRCEPMAPLRAELFGLVGGDSSGGKQSIDPLGPHRPDFAFGERLPQIRKIRERLHHLHVLRCFKLLLERFEIELAFQMMHAGFEECFAVQGAPEADGAERIAAVPGPRAKNRPYSSSGDRSTSAKMMMPAVGCSRTCAPQPAVSRHRIVRGNGSRASRKSRSSREMLARRAIGVVIVIGPADPELILPQLSAPGPARFRRCQNSRSAAKKRSHARSTPRSAIAASIS